MTFPTPVPPGWYPDPETPGFERRWNGQEWLGTSHKTPKRSSMLGPSYDRAYWTNGNPPARIARWLGLVYLIPMIAFFTLVIPPRNIDPTWLIIATASVAVSIPVELAAIAFAAAGIGRARAGAGGFAFTIQAVISGAVLTVFSVGILGLLVILGARM